MWWLARSDLLLQFSSHNYFFPPKPRKIHSWWIYPWNGFSLLLSWRLLCCKFSSFPISRSLFQRRFEGKWRSEIGNSSVFARVATVYACHVARTTLRRTNLFKTAPGCYLPIYVHTSLVFQVLIPIDCHLIRYYNFMFVCHFHFLLLFSFSGNIFPIVWTTSRYKQYHFFRLCQGHFWFCSSQTDK